MHSFFHQLNLRNFGLTKEEDVICKEKMGNFWAITRYLNRLPHPILNFILNESGQFLHTKHKEIKRHRITLAQAPSRPKTLKTHPIPKNEELRCTRAIHDQRNSARLKFHLSQSILQEIPGNAIIGFLKINLKSHRSILRLGIMHILHYFMG